MTMSIPKMVYTGRLGWLANGTTSAELAETALDVVLEEFGADVVARALVEHGAAACAAAWICGDLAAREGGMDVMIETLETATPVSADVEAESAAQLRDIDASYAEMAREAAAASCDITFSCGEEFAVPRHGEAAHVIVRPLSTLTRREDAPAGRVFEGLYVPHDASYVPAPRAGFTSEQLTRQIEERTIDGWSPVPMMQSAWPATIGSACRELRERGLTELADELMLSHLWTYATWSSDYWVRPLDGAVFSYHYPHQDAASSLAGMILARRMSYPLRRRELAELTGISEHDIARYEQAEAVPASDELERLQAVLGPMMHF